MHVMPLSQQDELLTRGIVDETILKQDGLDVIEEELDDE